MDIVEILNDNQFFHAMQSIFTDKEAVPGERDLAEKLGPTFSLWNKIRDYLNDFLKEPSGEWNYSGKNYGSSYRMKSKKRNIIYFLPKAGFFKVTFAFGQRATDQVMKSDVKDVIKHKLQEARVYGEGRGIRIDVQNEKIIKDIKTLTQIKLDFQSEYNE